MGSTGRAVAAAVRPDFAQEILGIDPNQPARRGQAVSVSDEGSQLEGAVRRAEFLFLAGRDFWDVGVGVDYLLDTSHSPGLPVRVRKVLEEGLLVTYCRPFSGRSGRTIGPDPDLNRDLRQFHDDIPSTAWCSQLRSAPRSTPRTCGGR
ncbi:MAG TPA: hypothetical protein VFP54_00070 [Acidimicrobiales bacterium]|nr:hypothetical protein [Acidimicrobiales bacterium]